VTHSDISHEIRVSPDGRSVLTNYQSVTTLSGSTKTYGGETLTAYLDDHVAVWR